MSNFDLCPFQLWHDLFLSFFTETLVIDLLGGNEGAHTFVLGGFPEMRVRVISGELYEIAWEKTDYPPMKMLFDGTVWSIVENDLLLTTIHDASGAQEFLTQILVS